jgi:hypothetical protein
MTAPLTPEQHAERIRSTLSRAYIGTETGPEIEEAAASLDALLTLLADAEARAEKLQRILDLVEKLMLSEHEPEDHVFRFFQRLHGLPETGKSKHPAEARVAELEAALGKIAAEPHCVVANSPEGWQPIIVVRDREYGYDECLRIARAALGEPSK